MVYPAEDLVEAGLSDLRAQRRTVGALLVLIGAERLRRAGIVVPEAEPGDPERELYELLAREDADGAHSRYNALVRALVSYERAVESAAR